MHLEDLSELREELERYRHERAILPPRERLDRQFDAIETKIDLHREADLHIHRVQLRAAIQRGRIEALLRGEDPEAATADLVRRDRELELARLERIRDSREDHPGIELEIAATRALLKGDDARATTLRQQARARYDRHVRLGRLGAIARLRPRAERTAAGTPFDASRLDPRRALELARLRRWASGHPVFVAGSTHEGDESSVALAFRRVARAGDPRVLLIVVPRLPSRGLSVRWELETGHGRVRLLRSPGRHRMPRSAELEPPDIVIVNALGLLDAIYSLADGVLIGGSLRAVREHDFCEPLAHGVLTGVGPYHGTHPERWELISRRAPELVEEVTVDDLDAMARRFLDRVQAGAPRRERADRAASFLPIVRDAERDALAALDELGPERIEWLRRIDAQGRHAFARCPHAQELLETGLVIKPRLHHSIGELPLLERLGLQPVALTGAARHLLRERGAIG